MLTKKQLEDMSTCDKRPVCGDCALKDQCNGNLADVLAEVANTALTYRAMLEKLEYGGSEFIEGQGWRNSCPVCEFTEGHGHAADCELARLIDKV